MATLTYDPTPADQPEFNEAEREALAVGEAAEAEQQQMYAGKFKDAESLEQAYIELQKKLGSNESEPEAEPEPESEQEPEQEQQQEEEVEEEQPSPELSKEDVEVLHSIVGGEKEYQSMVQWAGQNLNEKEIEMFDAVIDKGDPYSCFFAVQALANRYNDAVGQDGNLLTGTSRAEKADVFRSQAEVVAAMSDPRYDADPAYRQDVFNKLERSELQY